LYSDYVSNKTNLRDVLSHRTGLGTFSGDVIWYKSDLSPKEIIMSASHLEQAYSFRNGYGYSNLMFITAGEVISSVTGKPWYQYVKSTFFEPLDMNRTVTSTNQLKSMRNVASPHKTINGKVVPIDWVNWDGMSAAGGIISSVHDMSLWLKLQLNHGIIDRDTIFTETAQNIMWTPHNNFTVSKSESEFYGRNFSGYGLGWGLNEYQNRKVVTHSGGYDGMFSRVTLVPSENLGIVILTNSMTSIGSWLVYDIMDAYFGKSMRNWNKFGLISQEKGDNAFNQRIDDQIAKRIKNTKPNYPTSDYIGEYYSDFYGTIKVEMQKGKLRLTFPRAKKLNATLEHWHYDTYQINWDEVHAWFSFGTVQFIADNQGKVNRIRFDIPNDDIFFEEIRAQKVK
ncbi:MAG: serine hydrolase, partial [Calditrichaeota bacterium]|nr:serine hydrolase [Calditrichota bacterium]